MSLCLLDMAVATAWNRELQCRCNPSSWTGELPNLQGGLPHLCIKLDFGSIADMSNCSLLIDLIFVIVGEAIQYATG